jgi:hypothetical protein
MSARKAPTTLASVFALLAAGVLPAVAESTLQSVHFQSGQSSATLEGSLVRGDSAIYSFSAIAGQTATIAVTSLEDNASFTIYQPPASVTHSDDGLDVNGSPLPGTDSGSDMNWTGKLPASGAYYLEVGGDRGNATYTLTISIR